MTTIVYGIKNCDTCRKTVKWMESEGIDHEFHDFREHALSDVELDKWIDAVGWEKLLNRRSTTWRNLSDANKSDIGKEKALELMLENPTLIKRPVIDTGARILVGFDDKTREDLSGL